MRKIIDFAASLIIGNSTGPARHGVQPNLYQEMAKFGAKDMEICMQCGTCSASCPLSTGSNAFPRKIYRYIQLGLKDKILQSAVPWLCYYCGECNKDCPRGAEPAETMMAARRWLTTQYDRTGLARRFYLSETWELGALGVLALGVVLLFTFFHGPIITDRVSVNSFAPVFWIEIGDLIMAAVLTAFLMANALRMFLHIMQGVDAPLTLYIKEAKAFVMHFLTQKRWRECGEDRSRWLKHFILVTGYMTMMTLVIVFIRWFQVDDDSWHFTSIFGYYATAVLLYITVEMFRSRLKKEEAIHRYSELSDWLFLILLFLTTLTGIIMHAVRLAGWPMGTYVMYVIHLAIAVPMLIIEVPFGKWSHLFYRPLAVFLATVKDKAPKASAVDAKAMMAEIGDAFMTCLQCGTCTSMCPWNRVSAYNPRRMMRQIALNSGTEQTVDRAVWQCVTCNACGESCPRGISLVDVIQCVRHRSVEQSKTPNALEAPLLSLEACGNPWDGPPEKRNDWAAGNPLPAFSSEHEYCLFTCCTSAYEPTAHAGTQALVQLLTMAGVSFGTLGNQEQCCGDPAHLIGATGLQETIVRGNTEQFLKASVRNILTTSPHCLNAFNLNYDTLNQTTAIVHYTAVLDRLVRNGRLKPILRIPRIVTYHDPCYLGRHSGIYDAPRLVLQSIPGLRLVEMPTHREDSTCCGGGGGGAWNDSDTVKQLGKQRIQEAIQTGAEVIATACPFCIRELNGAAAQLKVSKQLMIKDVAQLLLQSVAAKQATDFMEPMASEVEQEEYHV